MFRVRSSVNYFLLFLINSCQVQQQQQCPYQASNISPLPLQNADDLCHPQTKECDPNNIYYSVDGTCNNLKYTNWGMSGMGFTRLLRANYSDGISAFRTSVDGSPLPLARVIRTKLLPHGYIEEPKETNNLFIAFGQFLDHDVSFMQRISSTEPCCVDYEPAPDQSVDECMPTIIPPDDEFYSKFGVTCLDVTRATSTKNMGCEVEPIYQINFQTAYWDLSFVYGWKEDLLEELRLHEGGLLKVSEENFPITGTDEENCPFGGVKREINGVCFITGDQFRVNQNPELLVMTVIFTRLHNYIAKNLLDLNPEATDEYLFQTSRRISVALYQQAITSEYLPLLIGPKTAALYDLYPRSSDYANTYNPHLNPQTLDCYTSGAGRGSHSTVLGKVPYLGSQGKNESYLLRDTYFNLGFLQQKDVFLHIVEAYGSNVCDQFDRYITEEVNNYFFQGLDLPYGQDLSSIDINRGLDFGLQPYNEYRVACGLSRLNSFDDLAPDLRNSEDAEKLKAMFNYVDDIPLYVGGLLEKPLPDGITGATFSCIIGESFSRQKHGDRLYYEHPEAKFTPSQLRMIRSSTFSEILCRTNPSMTEIPRKAFQIPSAQNPMVACDSLTQINLNHWENDYENNCQDS